MRSGFLLPLTMLGLAAGPVSAQTAAPPPPLHVFQPPPGRWDPTMLTFRPGLQQTATDLANLTRGLTFGMSATEVNAFLPDPLPGLTLNGLPMANEYPGEVRYFGVAFAATGPLRMDISACPGEASYVVFLFNGRSLFRLSYRLVADKACPDTSEAARQIFERFVPVGTNVAMSARYQTGTTEVVDITDPNVRTLIPVRWRKGIN